MNSQAGEGDFTEGEVAILRVMGMLEGAIEAGDRRDEVVRNALDELKRAFPSLSASLRDEPPIQNQPPEHGLTSLLELPNEWRSQPADEGFVDDRPDS